MNGESTQHQKGGDHSTNVQIQKVVLGGLSYKDVRDLALDVFRQNFETLAAKAGEIARQRAEEITDKFLAKLKEQNPAGVTQADDPDFQLGLYTVQREFARTGDPKLGDVLVDLLLERSKHPQRDVLQIALTESLSVATKLTTDQFAALTVAFIFLYTKHLGIGTASDLVRAISQDITPFVPELSKKLSCYQHLEFASCVTIGISRNDLPRILKNTYPNVFSKGINRERIETDFPEFVTAGNLLVTDPIAPGAYLFRVADAESLPTKLSQINLDPNRIAQVQNLWNASLMDEAAIGSYMEESCAGFRDLNQIWNGSRLSSITLTSVGIAIAHAYFTAKVQYARDADLSIWIN